MGIAMVDAVRLATSNKRSHEDLTARHERLVRRIAAETTRLEKVRREMYDGALIPFREVFGRLKNVDLAELAAIDTLPSSGLPDVELHEVRVSAAQMVGAMAGGAVAGVAAGAGAGAATVAAVGAFATASTGVAISGLSGAAATSATLAWLGGGSLAAGGGGVAAGTTVLTAIVAAPVVLVFGGVLGGVLAWQGRRARKDQGEIAGRLDEADAELRLAETMAEAVLVRSEQVRDVLTDLYAAVLDRLPRLEVLLDANDNYATYTPEQRRLVALLVGLATTAVTVMSARLTDEDGMVTDLSGRVVDDAQGRLNTMGSAAA
ncbi:hypothetical protein [Frankia sp. CiP3]|uniref:hypothetical protein n=1 Tax=Frankia sp. CiP3 TaxID=2880971 RepID=UPI001EF6F788|nr:hypothetical protein [Frankia sp. CiP3]